MDGSFPENPVGSARRDIEQLTDRFEERVLTVSALQRKLSRLLGANLSMIEDLHLAGVLTRIVEAAVDLVGASYGAIGVLAPDGSLEEFVHVGMDRDTVERIGRLPAGKGLLGALVDDPRPLRLDQLSQDPRSVGFPEHHPEMTSFLGVPIHVRDEVFGNLYLCDPPGRPGFSVEDEEVTLALAASAGLAIENARLYEVSRRRERWAEGTAQVMEEMIGHGSEALQLIADRVLDLADADLVSVLRPRAGALIAEHASGEGSQQILGATVQMAESLPGRALITGRPQMVDDIADGSLPTHLEVSRFGPQMAVPLRGVAGAHGVLAVARRRNGSRFTEDDLDVAASFAAHATVALELADAHATRERLTLLEDRERIARDLHDHVIQRLFAIGLTLQGLGPEVDDDQAATRLSHQVIEIDETIRQVRNTIFELRSSEEGGTLRASVLRIARSAGVLLGTEPRVQFVGPVDTLVPDDLHADVLAVVREAISNCAKHAAARHVDVTVEVTPELLEIRVVDDGAGFDPGSGAVRSGLLNLKQRAERHAGELAVDAIEPHGTRLRWTVSLGGVER